MAKPSKRRRKLAAPRFPERVSLRPMCAIVSNMHTQEPEELVFFRRGGCRAISVVLAPGDAQMLAGLLSLQEAVKR